MAASRAMRRAIAARDAMHHRELRLASHSICDFCGRTPEWYYECPVICVLADGVPRLEREVPPALRLHARYSYDRGWLACADCHARIEAGDREGLSVRWRSSQTFTEAFAAIPRDRLRRAERDVAAVHALFFEHKTGPEKIYE